MTDERKLTELFSAHLTKIVARPPKFSLCECGHVGHPAKHLTKIVDRYRTELQVFPTGKAVIHDHLCDCGQCSGRRGAQASLDRRW